MEQIKQMWKYLEGKKTYIFGVLISLWNVLDVFNIVSATSEQGIAVNAFLIALMGMSMAARISRESK